MKVVHASLRNVVAETSLGPIARIKDLRAHNRKLVSILVVGIPADLFTFYILQSGHEIAHATTIALCKIVSESWYDHYRFSSMKNI